MTLCQLGLMPSIKKKKKKRKQGGEEKKRKASNPFIFFLELSLFFFFFFPFLMDVSEQLRWPGAGREWQSLSRPDEWWAYGKHRDNARLGSARIETALSPFTAQSRGNEKR